MPPNQAGQASLAITRISTNPIASMMTKPIAKRMAWRVAYGSGAPPAALYSAT